MKPDSIIDFPEQKEFFTIVICSLPSFSFPLFYFNVHVTALVENPNINSQTIKLKGFQCVTELWLIALQPD